MSFAHPELLWLALALPALVGLGVWAWSRRRRRAARALGSESLLERIGAGDLASTPAARLVLLVLAAAALGFAAAGPRWGLETVEEGGRAADVVLALDVSRSMLATDVSPDRMERQRLLARRIVRELAGDRLGLVAFAGRAYALTPLTGDHGMISLYLDALDPDIVSQGGSTLSAAVRQAADLVRGPEDAGRGVVVLVSDGEALEDRDAVLREAERAARVGVTIHTVGVGTTSGAPVPARPGPDGISRDYTRGPDGEVVISRLDEELMRAVADATGGRYVRLGEAGATDALVRTLAGLDRVEGDPRRGVRPRARHAAFILLALVLLATDGLLRPRRRTRPAAAEPRPAAAAPGPTGGPRAAGGAARTSALLLLVVLTTAAVFGGFERGNRHYRAGEYREAVEAYQSALGTRADGPVLRYNLGTALLRLGRYQEAEEHLRRALDTVDPGTRGHVHYNLGLRFLEEARDNPDPQAAAALYEAAVEAYRQALRLGPADGEAKWNYELALQERDEHQQSTASGGDEQDQEQDPQEGGEGVGSPAPGRPDDPAAQPHGTDHAPMTQEEAERILAAMEQDERELLQDRLRQGRQETPPTRDW